MNAVFRGARCYAGLHPERRAARARTSSASFAIRLFRSGASRMVAGRMKPSLKITVLCSRLHACAIPPRRWNSVKHLALDVPQISEARPLRHSLQRLVHPVRCRRTMPAGQRSCPTARLRADPALLLPPCMFRVRVCDSSSCGRPQFLERLGWPGVQALRIEAGWPAAALGSAPSVRRTYAIHVQHVEDTSCCAARQVLPAAAPQLPPAPACTRTASSRQNTTTCRTALPSCSRSKPRLISSSFRPPAHQPVHR